MIIFLCIFQVLLQFFILFLYIFEILNFLFKQFYPIGLTTFNSLAHVKYFISSLRLLYQVFLRKLVNRCERTKECRQLLTHISFLFIDLQIIHHDLEHCVLLFVMFYLLL